MRRLRWFIEEDERNVEGWIVEREGGCVTCWMDLR